MTSTYQITLAYMRNIAPDNNLTISETPWKKEQPIRKSDPKIYLLIVTLSRHPFPSTRIGFLVLADKMGIRTEQHSRQITSRGILLFGSYPIHRYREPISNNVKSRHL
jgi:hypothetical protein